jgi:hypothetical protein
MSLTVLVSTWKPSQTLASPSMEDCMLVLIYVEGRMLKRVSHFRKLVEVWNGAREYAKVQLIAADDTVIDRETVAILGSYNSVLLTPCYQAYKFCTMWFNRRLASLKSQNQGTITAAHVFATFPPDDESDQGLKRMQAALKNEKDRHEMVRQRGHTADYTETVANDQAGEFDLEE